MEILGYLAALLMGIVLGLIGGGGSILTVPILVYLFQLSPSLATGYSLLVVGVTAAFGSVRYLKQGLVDLQLALLFAVPSIIAVYVSRAYLMPAIPDVLILTPFTVQKSVAIMVLFALLMLFSALMMLKRSSRPLTHLNNTTDGSLVNVKAATLIVFEGAVVGVLTGILGAGGGFLIIPVLVLLLNMPIKNAVGTSLLIIALKSLIGFWGDIQVGIELDLSIIIPVLVATLSGMALSTRLTEAISGTLLQKLFAWFTLLIAVFILLNETI